MVFLWHEFYMHTRFSEMHLVQIYVLMQEVEGNDVFMMWNTKRWIIMQIITQYCCLLKLIYDKNDRLVFQVI